VSTETEETTSEVGRILSLEERDNRLDRIEAAVDKLTAAVSGILPGSRKEAGDRLERRLDRPSTVQEQVEAELAKREKDAADQKRNSEHEDLKSQVAKLSERPPAEPARRATKLLGWGG
jgi:hypothetical protein